MRDDGRGCHTTTHRQLVPLPGGALLLDTPGMRELGLWDADDGLARQFDDLAAPAARCRFADCAHDAEPGCAVRAAAEGDPALRARVESWRKVEREQRKREADVAGHVRAERHRAVRSFSRSLRARPDKRRGW